MLRISFLIRPSHEQSSLWRISIRDITHGSEVSLKKAISSVFWIPSVAVALSIAVVVLALFCTWNFFIFSIICSLDFIPKSLSKFSRYPTKSTTCPDEKHLCPHSLFKSYNIKLVIVQFYLTNESPLSVDNHTIYEYSLLITDIPLCT
jgi:hypothetical protein